MGGFSSKPEDDNFSIPTQQIIDVSNPHQVAAAARAAAGRDAPAREVGLSDARHSVKAPLVFQKESLTVNASGMVSFEVDSSVDFVVELYAPALEVESKQGETLIWPHVAPPVGRTPTRKTFKPGSGIKVSFDGRAERVPAGERRAEAQRKGSTISWPFAVLLWPGRVGAEELPRTPPDGALLTFCTFVNNQPKVHRQVIAWGGLPQEIFLVYGVGVVDKGAKDVDDREKLCVVCLTDPRDTALLPCGHFCVCYECATHIRLSPTRCQCPMCRSRVNDICRISLVDEPETEVAPDPMSIEAKDVATDAGNTPSAGVGPTPASNAEALTRAQKRLRPGNDALQASAESNQQQEAPNVPDPAKLRELRLQALQSAIERASEAQETAPPVAAVPAANAASSSSSSSSNHPAAAALPARCLSRLGRELKQIETQRDYLWKEHKIEWSLSDPDGASLQAWILKIYTEGVDQDAVLAKELRRTNIEFIKLEVWITSEYPYSPPLVRVLDPSFGTGSFFVIRGALCMDVLTKQGWNPAVSLLQLGIQIKSMMTSGKGSVSGPNRSGGFGAGEREQAWKTSATIAEIHTDWKNLENGT